MFGFMPAGYDVFSCEGLRDEGHDVLCLGLPLLVLVRQFVDESHVYPYRVEVRVSTLSCFESFVEEFLWIGSTHRQEQCPRVPITSALPEFFEASRCDQHREKFCLRVGVNECPQTLLAFFHIRFDMNNVLSVGQHSEMAWLYATSHVADMVNLSL